MAGIAQLVERQNVALNVAGSRPVARPPKHLNQSFLSCGSQ